MSYDYRKEKSVQESLAIGQRMKAGFFHFFRERQIYMRSDGKVRFLTLRPWMQMSFFASLLIAAGWVAFATFNAEYKDIIIAQKDEHTADLQTHYEGRIERLQQEIERINQKLMLDQDEYLDRVEKVRELQDLLEQRQRTLETVLKKGWKGASSVKHQVTRKPVKTAGVFEGWFDSILPESLTGANKRRHFTTKRDAVAPIDSLRKEIAVMEERQNELLDNIELDRKSRVARIEKSIKSLGIRPSRVMVSAKSDSANVAVGGPFVALHASSAAEKKYQDKIDRIIRYADRIERYRLGIQKLPISRAMPSRYPITSRFGIRRDPFKRTRAMHQGIDFRAPRGASVAANADGRVVRAGRVGGYGKLVEIRHRNGITTRYAHLSRIDVKVGQRVKKHTRIGRIGSTGRSTGPHLHYETRVYGRAIDPRKFWRAGSNVLKEEIN